MASMRLAKATSVSGFSKQNFLTNGIKIQILQCAQEREIRTQGYLALEYCGVGWVVKMATKEQTSEKLQPAE